MEKRREVWVDDVKVIACILVVLGHFFQSMTKADILPANDLYKWFNQTIYYFHVPLFFICSGYLYQKFSCVDSIGSWKKNVLTKTLALGVPYFTFSFATWLLKTIFSSSINDRIGGLFETLFLHPASPYWYLYALFFVFLITATFKCISMSVVGFTVAMFGKVLIIMRGGNCVYAVSTVLSNEIWFVMGMCIGVIPWKPLKKWVSMVIVAVFIGLSVLVYQIDISNEWISFLLGILACIAVVELVSGIAADREQNTVFALMAKYMMPIFVMHTLFAAPLREALLKAGIYNAAIHIVSGIAISFVGPIIAAEIMKKTKLLEFFLYPVKFIKVK